MKKLLLLSVLWISGCMAEESVIWIPCDPCSSGKENQHSHPFKGRGAPYMDDIIK